MDITIIGPGMVGAAIAAEASKRGHTVTTASRSGKEVPGATKSLALDFSDTAKVQELINSSDVTVIAAVTRNDYASTLKSHQKLIDAGFATRVITVGGAGSLEVNGTLLADTPEFPAEYKQEADIFTAVLQAYRASKDDWTVVSPSPEITPGPTTGAIKVGQDSPAGGRVTTGDFAVGVLDEIENPQYRQARFTIASA